MWLGKILCRRPSRGNPQESGRRVIGKRKRSRSGNNNNRGGGGVGRLGSRGVEQRLSCVTPHSADEGGRRGDEDRLTGTSQEFR